MNSRLRRIQDWRALGDKARYNVRTLAILAGVAPRQLQRFFVETHGMTPREWLQGLRIWRARELLASGHTMKEAATLLHFANASGLCRLLHRPPPAVERRGRKPENVRLG